MYKFNLMDKFSSILVILGAVNWGLLGLFNFNIIAAIFGEPAPMIAIIIYILAGIAGLNMILILIKMKNSIKA